MHEGPTLSWVTVRERPWQRLERESAFRGRFVMTLQTILPEDLQLGMVIEGLGCRGGGVGENAERKYRKEVQDHSDPKDANHPAATRSAIGAFADSMRTRWHDAFETRSGWIQC